MNMCGRYLARYSSTLKYQFYYFDDCCVAWLVGKEILAMECGLVKRWLCIERWPQSSPRRRRRMGLPKFTRSIR